MIVAIFSDIHGNDIAFEAAVNDAKKRGATKFIVAGDMVSDYPLSSQVIKRARELTPYVVKGNREVYFEKFYSNIDLHWKEFKQFAGMLWSFGHMVEDDFSYISSLSEQMKISLDSETTIMLTHYIENIDEYIKTIPQKILVCGHTHEPSEVWYGEKLFLNPGSVGLNLSTGFNAEYMLLNYSKETIKTEIIQVAYEKQRIKELISNAALIRDENAVNWFKILFATQESGISYIRELFKNTERIKAARGYDCYDTPNEIWDEVILMFKDKRIIS